MPIKKLKYLGNCFSHFTIENPFFCNYSGGRVLVKAEVKEIILSKGQKGVIVQKGQDRYRIGKERDLN